ncbi:MAG TPA: aminomethyl-transferring glycine dehydrogenase subunit GcvPA [Terriglobia bacterium]|nr:aminomethyl-transferring glycine dehydrogenase subunit GcvPA [Terriglobia bacterium]
MRYLPNSDADRAAMLEATGCSSVEDFFDRIPSEMRLQGRLNLPGPFSEPEILEFFRQAARRSACEYVSLLGAGAYSHYVPVAVKALLSRGEFFTAYTPYQAEIAQGTLQAMFEFQTLMTQLTGMEAGNASLYDGSTATTEAVLMAMRVTRRNRVLLARTVHPEYCQVLKTYIRHQSIELQQVPYEASGQVDLARLESALNAETAAVVVQSPNFFGTLERTSKIAEAVHRSGALLIVTITEPLSLALVKPPREADIVCGEAQSFGVGVAFGGPYVGFLTAKAKFLRQMPGRLVGQTVDTEGRRGFVLTLATREQHIRREKATSNICTNQSLCALAVTIYLSLLGKNGLKRLGEQNLAKAHYAARRLAAIPGVATPFGGPHFNEFVVRTPIDADELLTELQKQKIIGGLNLERFYPELSNHLLVCVTETVGRETIDCMVEAFRRAAGSEPEAQGGRAGAELEEAALRSDVAR